jgi:two-component system OmpR family sensor kinase
VSTLRGRLARFYAFVLACVLLAFAGTVWVILEAEEAAEPPLVQMIEPPEQTGTRLVLALLAALPIAIAVGAGGAVLISRRGLQPLDAVIATAGRINTENLAERIAAPRAVDEVALLVTSVNAMLERLEHSVEGMRRFTADASHELRTPLGVLMGELEVTLRRERSPEELRGTIENTLEELGRLARLVDSLLTLARADASGLPLQAVDLDLAATVTRAIEPYEAVLAARKITLSLSCERARAHADPLWVGRIVANLLDNACKFTPDGGRVEVRVRDRAVEISDSGAGVPADEAARVFERFYRGALARAHTQGFGLGLPLAREIARAQGGELTLVAGSRFLLELPPALPIDVAPPAA